MIAGTPSTARLVFGCALLPAMVDAVAPIGTPPAAAQEDNGLASITIYTAICPVGYADDDLFVDCYDNPGTNVEYALTGGQFNEAVLISGSADGFAAVEGLNRASEYLLETETQGDVADLAIFCSDEFGEPFDSAAST